MPISDLLSATGALGLVIALIVLLRLSGRWLGRARGGGGGVLRLRGQLALDNRRRLLLVECGQGSVLVLTGGSTDQMLAWPPDTAASATPFAAILAGESV